MNLIEWRKAQQAGEEYELPSGLEVTLKPVSLLDMAAGKSIPQTLIAPVNDLIKRGQAENPTLDDLAAMGPVVDLVASACLVSPAELSVSELPFGDKLAIFEWANGGEQKKLATFRQK